MNLIIGLVVVELIFGIAIVTIISIGRNIMDPKDTGYINSNFETDEDISVAE